MAGSGGLLFVCLRNPDVLRESGSAASSTEDVVIGAGQSYEDALKEVSTHLRIPQDDYTARFAQVHRGKSYMVAPSAWGAIEAGAELELVVEKKRVEGAPAAQGDDVRPAEAAVVAAQQVVEPARLDLFPPQLPPSQPRSSQNSAIVVPATPEHTDESDQEERHDEDAEVSDSDVEGSSAYKRRVLVRPEEMEEEATPRQPFFVQRPSSPTSPRPDHRSPSPSPSAMADRKEEVRRRIKAEDKPWIPLPRESPAPLQAEPSQPGLAVPSAAQAPPEQQEPHRSPTPPSRYLPADDRVSDGPEQSWAVWLNSEPEFNVFQPSPEEATVDKGKGRAPPSPAPEERAVGDAGGALSAVKHDPRPSQIEAPEAVSSFASSSTSSYLPGGSTAPVPLESEQPAAFASTSRLRLDHLEQQEQAFSAIKPPPSSSQPLPVASSAPSPRPSTAKRKASLSGSPSSVGRSAKRGNFAGSSSNSSGTTFSIEIPSPSRRAGPPVRTAVDSTSSASSLGSASSSSTTINTALSRSSTSFSVPKKRPVGPREPLLPASSNSNGSFAIFADPAPADSSPPVSVPAAAGTPSGKSQSATVASTPRPRARRKTLTAAERAEREAEEIRAAEARGRASLPPFIGSQRFKMWLRAPPRPRTPANIKSPFKDVDKIPIQPRHRDGFNLTTEQIFEDAVKFTEWPREELRLVFCPGTDKETKVWGMDRPGGAPRTLRELGCENREAIDIDWVGPNPERPDLAQAEE